MDDDLTAPVATEVMGASQMIDGGEVTDVSETSGAVDGTDGLEVDVSTLDAIEHELEDIERALALLDEGTYGTCEVCGDRIDDGVLVDAPATRFCAAHLPIVLN